MSRALSLVSPTLCVDRVAAGADTCSGSGLRRRARVRELSCEDCAHLRTHRHGRILL